MNDELIATLNRLTTRLLSIEERLTDIENDMATRQQVSAVYDLLDKNISEHQRQDEERAAMASQLDRHDGWIQDLGKQAGVNLR